MKAAELERIFTELIAIYENLKAEVIVAELNENFNVPYEDFIVTHKSTFSRPYRRDIIDIDNLTYDNCLNLNLSRNGLYDQLPEGLFHLDTSEQSGEPFSQKRKKFKEEEVAARSFFAPIENELFFQRLNIEVKERQVLDDFYNLNDDFLIDFWNISNSIPEEYLLKLVKTLPYSHHIAGDLELTRLCLERILGDEIAFKMKYDDEIEQPLEARDNTGLQLGVDMILQTTETVVLNPKLVVTIGPISENKINSYLKKDGILNFINTFYDYFIPMEFDVETKFTVDNTEGFLLDEQKCAIMGVSTFI